MQRILEHVKPERRNKEIVYNPIYPLFWQRSFHFETIEQLLSFAIPLVVPVLKFSGIYQRGLRNALDICQTTFTISDPNLPPAFHGFKILFLSDLHIDGNDALIQPFCEALQEVEVDLCLLGGDYRFHIRGEFRKVMDRFEQFVPCIRSKEGIIGILGNHDSWEMIRPLERLGIVMLVNETMAITRKDERIWVLGLDDPHYYKCDDYQKANQGIPDDAFRILLSHATAVLFNLDSEPVNLCLCGHTHAGQISLPVLGPVITHSTLKGPFVYGHWQYKHIKGYTTSGVGTSAIPVRYNTRSEIVVITLTSDHVPAYQTEIS
jgi:predicted MPP superfamily phosphohydrolase